MQAGRRARGRRIAARPSGPAITWSASSPPATSCGCPAARFRAAIARKLKDYFDRLGADGAESLTAPRGRFGLTEKELTAVLADLAQPIDFETKGQPPRAVLDRLQAKLATEVRDRCRRRRERLRKAAPVADELKGFSAGTALAIMLRSCWPRDCGRKSRAASRWPIASPSRAPAAIGQSTLGKTDATRNSAVWPIGWEPDKSPGAVAPSLFESLNAEIDGYTLEEALAAIAPPLKVPMYFDHAALAAHTDRPGEDSSRSSPATRTSYKRVIDRILPKRASAARSASTKPASRFCGSRDSDAERARRRHSETVSLPARVRLRSPHSEVDVVVDRLHRAIHHGGVHVRRHGSCAT